MKKACVIEEPITAQNNTTKEYNEYLPLRVDYNIIREKVKELNELGVDITLEEIADIIETKWCGEPTKSELRRKLIQPFPYTIEDTYVVFSLLKFIK